MGVVLPGDASIADFLDDLRIRVALKRGKNRAERPGVLGADRTEAEAEAGEVEITDVRRLVIRNEELGDAGVFENLDPVFVQVALKPCAGDVEAFMLPACVVNLPGCALSGRNAAGFADHELGNLFLRRRIGKLGNPSPRGKSSWTVAELGAVEGGFGGADVTKREAANRLSTATPKKPTKTREAVIEVPP